MKIAVVSDIHANIEALKAVLKRAKQLGVQQLFGLGDYVGYYYHPKECLELLLEWNNVLIKGNHEELLFESMQDEKRAQELKQKYGSGLLVASQQLDEKYLRLLKEMPSETQITIDQLRIGLYHGAPFDNTSYLYPDTNKLDLDKCTDSQLDISFFGHSHYQFCFQTKNTFVVNAGSVGQARDIGKQATWILLDTASQTISIQRTPYDISSEQAMAKENDPENQYLWKVLERGTS